MKRYILFIIIILLIGCDLFQSQEEPDNPPNIYQKEPSAYLLTQKIGDSISFEANANDADDDPIEYKTLKDGSQVNETNTFEFIIDQIGGFVIQIIAYNAEADTAEWYVSVENQQPIISYMGHVNKNEDEIIIGEVVKSPTISDLEDDISELSVELSQTNTDLIKLVLDSDNQIIVDDYQNGASGFSQVQYRVTDTGGYSNTKGFHYIINPMTDIEGNILDSDTWEPNTGLQGFVIIYQTSFGITKADTVWSDVNGMYKIQIEPEESIDIEAGYRSLDKTQPMSFITTARGILASNDVSGADIIVVTYLNNNLTSEEMRILAWETNFGPGNYTGAKVPSIEMTDKLILSGNPAIDWAGEEYLEEMTAEEIADIKRVIADSINIHQKHPFPLEETIYDDGIMDYLNIVTRRIHEGYYDDFISNLLEEGYGSRGQYYGVTSPELEGKTISYEYIGIEWVHDADIKFIKFIEGVAHEIGYLKPKMPLDDVFRIQE